jgi:hypothetical protein
MQVGVQNATMQLIKPKSYSTPLYRLLARLLQEEKNPSSELHIFEKGFLGGSQKAFFIWSCQLRSRPSVSAPSRGICLVLRSSEPLPYNFRKPSLALCPV